MIQWCYIERFWLKKKRRNDMRVRTGSELISHTMEALNHTSKPVIYQLF